MCSTGASKAGWPRSRRASETAVEGKAMSTLVQDIEAQIAGAKAAVAEQNVGVIREVGDGVARVEGLDDVMLNEMLDLGHGLTGLALSLEDSDVGVIILGDDTALRE